MPQDTKSENRFRLSMSLDQFKAFLEAVVADSTLHQKMDAATSEEDVVAIACSSGFEVTIEDLKSGQTPAGEELSDDEMLNAAGGAGSNEWNWKTQTGAVAVLYGTPGVVPPSIYK
ncbi:Nif11-like leader peptide family natural product precursor [Synechococcus sp. CS-197]|uniref:Nif11-like leader peptide family natural product precursor n=1 Tax=Synechococcus sp. CS-197 TaxID=2847985 RepID=UPI00223BA782|nr:Nif11-like leader peptide family natural product precursor [Synechococcus sp. CS-197]